ncbi:MAG: hypothetical protein OXE59_06980, partial [Bacteroidetes bacterium]|nr:hypothetical protein [Bacteroidota bacterium]
TQINISPNCGTFHPIPGVGYVYSTPQSGGLSLRYKSFQVIVDASFTARRAIDGFAQTEFHVPRVALRYNYSVGNVQRVKFYVYSQIGRHKSPIIVLPTRFLFTGGGSAEFQIGRAPSSKGFFLSVDVGLTIDDKGNLNHNPSRGLSLHYVF